MSNVVTNLTIFLMIIFYIIVGITFMGVFPDSKGEPNCSLIFMWPVCILHFTCYSILFGSYELGKTIRKRLISIYNKYYKRKKKNKEDRCDEIIKEILKHWDE